MKISKCCDCCNTECSWHKEFKPVDGWNAEHTIVDNGRDKQDSYYVKECPLYKTRDGDRRISRNELVEMLGVNSYDLTKKYSTSQIQEELYKLGYDSKLYYSEEERYYNRVTKRYSTAKSIKEKMYKLKGEARKEYLSQINKEPVIYNVLEEIRIKER